MSRHFLSINDLSVYQFNWIFDLAEKVKSNPQDFRESLKDRIAALWLESPSYRTQASFESGLKQLGGHSMLLDPSDMKADSKEDLQDIRKTLEGWISTLIMCPRNHANVSALAESQSMNVINAESDRFHPCQALADFFTLKEKKGGFSGLKLAYIGKAGNICHSLILASAKAGNTIHIATPECDGPDEDIVRAAEEKGSQTGFMYRMTHDPYAAVENADAVYTSSWESRDESPNRGKTAAFPSTFQINKSLMERCMPDAVFMHNFPICRDKEVSAEILETSRSIVFEQAENRLHVQKAIMLLLEKQ